MSLFRSLKGNGAPGGASGLRGRLWAGPLRSGRPRAVAKVSLRGSPPGARTAIGRFARPAGRALRLPALHLFGAHCRRTGPVRHLPRLMRARPSQVGPKDDIHLMGGVNTLGRNIWMDHPPLPLVPAGAGVPLACCARDEKTSCPGSAAHRVALRPGHEAVARMQRSELRDRRSRISLRFIRATDAGAQPILRRSSQAAPAMTSARAV